MRTYCFLLSKSQQPRRLARLGGTIFGGSLARMTILATFAIDSCAAANGTLAQLRKSMAIELAPKNLQLNAVGAEWVITDSTIGLKSSLFYKLLARIPVRRFGTAAELACAAVMLTSHPCGFVTEASLSADGGCAIG